MAKYQLLGIYTFFCPISFENKNIMNRIRLALIACFFFTTFSLLAQVVDKSGNSYKTVTIGTQVWMAENLNTSKFRNGDSIPEAKTNAEWVKAANEGKPAWCYYFNNSSNGKLYGKLYNFFAVTDKRGLAPEGWHIPEDAEWDKLADQLGGAKAASRKLKSTNGWEDDTNGSNESGFNAFPGGKRLSDGDCEDAGVYGYWWSATAAGTGLAFNRNLFLDNFSFDKAKSLVGYGLSVRCVKN